ncbi:UDP-glucuronosyltransferase 2C1 [Ooceraea biroi]|uniref:UDP-glucuronosyltransferase 2C1 n=1 Tax=Ooceraea biroi TaxID=2015173 RepID=A0A026W309_OOCBI|nr:UDP-glucuronosyltransferase 2C1 [Ooceraea biroi]
MIVTNNKDRETKHYICFPFVKGLSDQVNRILKEYQINVLHSVNKKVDCVIKCGKDEMTNSNKTGVVYRINCVNCEACYVGQTGRHLATRISEHRKDINKCENNWSVVSKHARTSAHKGKCIATAFGNDICETHLGSLVIQNLVHNPPKNPPYDAMIMEIFGSPCFAAIAHLLNIPVIGVSTTSMYPWLHELIAQPENLAFIPNNCGNVNFSMNLWQRIYNVFSFLYCKLYFHYLTIPQDDMVRKYLGPNLPSIRNMNPALVLINSHIALNGILPMTPALVQIGGIHIREDDSPLSHELKKWMDDSKDGFVYFTFGSMILIETFPRKILDVFYASLGKIAPVRVLMKVPNPKKLPPGLPENIRTFSWLPQLKVLNHPNIRAFITHGGIMGIFEAIIYGVPMIGMPLCMDQYNNIDTNVAKNIAVKLDVYKITEKDMDVALNAILHDPRYIETIKNLSRRFHDQSLSPVDTANYWIDYVLKYGDDVLRSPAMDLAWWQIYLIDVAACLLLCAAAIITIAVFIARFVIKMINRNHYKLLHAKKTN